MRKSVPVTADMRRGLIMASTDSRRSTFAVRASDEARRVGPDAARLAAAAGVVTVEMALPCPCFSC